MIDRVALFLAGSNASPRLLKSGAHVAEDVKGNTLEMLAAFQQGDAKAFGMKVRRSDDRKSAVTIRCDGNTLDVAGSKVPF